MSNAPIQLRNSIHIGSLMDIVYLNILQTYCHANSKIVISSNTLGKFREKDASTKPEIFSKLFEGFTGTVDQYLGNEETTLYISDSSGKIQEIVFELVRKLIENGDVYLHNYQAHFCEKCDSFLAPIEFEICSCSNCGQTLTQKSTYDLFIKTNKDRIKQLVSNSVFEPTYCKNKFMGTFDQMPEAYAITKKRTFGLSASSFDTHLDDRVLDPKFIFSLYPIIIEKISGHHLQSIVIGDDILGRYLYYLLANSSLLNIKPLNIYVHGLLVSDGKKISKYGNLLIDTDSSIFLKEYSWEHLFLLCVSSRFGKNIDFQKKIAEASKVIIKRHNVLLFMKSRQQNIVLASKAKTLLEISILDHILIINQLLAEFKLFDFYKAYRKLWFELLSSQYIPQIKRGIVSRQGLKDIISQVKRLP